MEIYTLTLNPAYDVHAYAEAFAPYRENLARIQSREAGGKGVNISRALNIAEIPNTAVIVLGKENSGDFKEALQRSQIDCILLEKEGRIRENLTLHCAGTPETRISFTGFSVDDSILTEVQDVLKVDSNTVITFTGRVASGMHMEKVKTFLKELREKGARIVLDSKSFSLEDIYQVRPWLIKPNQEEISEYFSCDVHSIPQAMEKAACFAAHGVDNVMVSLGEQGALLISGGKSYIATPPAVQPVSTIGAGDSSIAGFLAAAHRGGDAKECLKTAVAFGTAACLTPGTQPPGKTDADRIFTQVEVTEVM